MKEIDEKTITKISLEDLRTLNTSTGVEWAKLKMLKIKVIAAIGAKEEEAKAIEAYKKMSEGQKAAIRKLVAN